MDQSRRTDIEILCEIIYAHGERYEDGTAAIGFTWLFKVTKVVVSIIERRPIHFNIVTKLPAKKFW